MCGLPERVLLILQQELGVGRKTRKGLRIPDPTAEKEQSRGRREALCWGEASWPHRYRRKAEKDGLQVLGPVSSASIGEGPSTGVEHQDQEELSLTSFHELDYLGHFTALPNRAAMRV